jgi:hypothetical protein
MQSCSVDWIIDTSLLLDRFIRTTGDWRKPYLVKKEAINKSRKPFIKYIVGLEEKWRQERSTVSYETFQFFTMLNNAWIRSFSHVGCYPVKSFLSDFFFQFFNVCWLFLYIFPFKLPPPPKFRKYFDRQRIRAIFALISCIVCSPTNLWLKSCSSIANKGMKLIIISLQIFALV